MPDVSPATASVSPRRALEGSLPPRHGLEVRPRRALVEPPVPRRHDALRVAGLWVLTRALAMVVLATSERLVVGDVFYYWRRIDALAQTGLGATLREYPTPVVWFLTLPQVAGGRLRAPGTWSRSSC